MRLAKQLIFILCIIIFMQYADASVNADKKGEIADMFEYNGITYSVKNAQRDYQKFLKYSRGRDAKNKIMEWEALGIEALIFVFTVGLLLQSQKKKIYNLFLGFSKVIEKNKFTSVPYCPELIMTDFLVSYVEQLLTENNLNCLQYLRKQEVTENSIESEEVVAFMRVDKNCEVQELKKYDNNKSLYYGIYLKSRFPFLNLGFESLIQQLHFFFSSIDDFCDNNSRKGMIINEPRYARRIVNFYFHIQYSHAINKNSSVEDYDPGTDSGFAFDGIKYTIREVHEEYKSFLNMSGNKHDKLKSWKDLNTHDFIFIFILGILKKNQQKKMYEIFPHFFNEMKKHVVGGLTTEQLFNSMSIILESYIRQLLTEENLDCLGEINFIENWNINPTDVDVPCIMKKMMRVNIDSRTLQLQENANENEYGKYCMKIFPFLGSPEFEIFSTQFIHICFVLYEASKNKMIVIDTASFFQKSIDDYFNKRNIETTNIAKKIKNEFIFQEEKENLNENSLALTDLANRRNIVVVHKNHAQKRKYNNEEPINDKNNQNIGGSDDSIAIQNIKKSVHMLINYLVRERILVVILLIVSTMLAVKNIEKAFQK